MKKLLILYLSFIYSFTVIGQQDTVYLIANHEKLDDFVAEKIRGNVGGVVFLLNKGEYHFSKTIRLRSNVHFIGRGHESIFVFDNEGAGNLFQAHGSISKERELCFNEFEVAESYVKIQKNRTTLELSGWAQGCIGEIVYCTEKKFELSQELKLIQQCFEDVKWSYKVLKPISNVKLMDFQIVRKDKSNHQTTNIDFKNVVNSEVENVRSLRCNYAHVSLSQCYNVNIDSCIFEDAFSHGNGGKAYGVSFQYTSTKCSVSNSIFKSLRHGVVFQAGAIKNKCKENYFIDGFWEDVMLPKFSSGDIVLHGNYPSFNLIESNICNNIVVDNSHGYNGPENRIERNYTFKYGIYCNRNSIDGKLYISNNDIRRKGLLKGKLRTKNNNVIEVQNRRNGKLISKECTNDKEEIMANNLSKIGYPTNFDEYSNNAFERYYKIYLFK